MVVDEEQDVEQAARIELVAESVAYAVRESGVFREGKLGWVVPTASSVHIRLGDLSYILHVMERNVSGYEFLRIVTGMCEQNGHELISDWAYATLSGDSLRVNRCVTCNGAVMVEPDTFQVYGSLSKDVCPNSA